MNQITHDFSSKTPYRNHPVRLPHQPAEPGVLTQQQLRAIVARIIG